MKELPWVDVVVLVLYVGIVSAVGSYFVRNSKTVAQFTSAGGRVPGWAVAFSLFGTYLSSMTFLGVPGKAYGGNWNPFVFSLTLPVAAFFASRYFIPFYRNTGEISAYTHLEARFGPWARTYTMLCYVLNQVARIGAILLGVALVLKSLLGWDMSTTIIVTGAIVTFYTLLGGIEAVVWTDVVQSAVLLIGAAAALFLLATGMPEGPGQILAIAREHGKLSLGSWGPSISDSTVWVVFAYGVAINLNNFGIDQDQVQRYHVARSQRSAARAVWAMALLYVPASLMFFVIGTSLFAYYEVHPEMLNEVRSQVAATRLDLDLRTADPTQQAEIAQAAAALTPADIGDKVFPHFIINGLPVGLVGLLVAALLAAAMSSIDTSLNCSATVILKDIYARFINPQATEKQSMRVLHGATLLWGAMGTTVALLLIRVNSMLDAWWLISGIFAGGMLGLFLLGFASRRSNNAGAVIGVIVGLLVIVWMTLPSVDQWPESLAVLRSPFHANLATVIGTLTIFLVGAFASRFFPQRSE